MAADRLTGLDLAFLSLEHPRTPLHMGAVSVFRPTRPVDPSRLVRLLGERVHRIPRMRQQVRRSWFPPAASWAEDPALDVDDHIHAHRLPGEGGHYELAALVARLMAEPLDMGRPPWQLHVITGLTGGRFALLTKLHHALCDGAGAVGLAGGLLDGPAAQPPTAEHADEAETPWVRTAAASAWQLLAAPERLSDTVADLAAGAGALLERGTRNLGIAAAVLGHSRVPDPGSPMLAAPSGQRRIGLLSLDVGEVQRIRRRHGGTVNDVVLAVVAGALRSWLLSRGHPVRDMTVRALIPVSQRRRGSGNGGGNQLSGYLCELPVGEPDPVRRLAAIRSRMDRNKAAGPHRGPGAVPLLADELPDVLHRFVLPFTRGGAPVLFDTVVTTVPLPSIAVSLDGAGLEEMYPLVPLAAGHALGIAIARYRNTVHIGLHADQNALPDLEKLSDAFPDALTDLAD